MSSERLGGGELAATMVAYAQALETHKETLNRLNVFPVPDGDTGTNMALTVQAAVAELEHRIGDSVSAAEFGPSAVAEALAHGSLMGARGNSGVILCQVIRGLSRALASAGPDGAGAKTTAEAIAAASQAAREAVLKPAEGTILTVAAAAADGALAAAGQGESLTAVLEAAREGARDGLWHTPELLAVLAEAGVVDAGGAGLLLLFDALVHVATGRPFPEEVDLPPAVAALVERGGASGSGVTAGCASGSDGDDPVAGLRYEVMYLLDAPDKAIPAFKDVWAGVGDSIVVVGGDGLWNCHIHTDDVGAAIEAALDAGRPRQIRVTDLAEQVEEERWVRQGGEQTAEPAPAPAAGPAPVTSVVAVATGEGIGRIFRSLGVAAIVPGGQSMNPSTAEILEIVESAPGEEVVFLPNNGNILPVAAQVAQVASKPVRVVPTRGVQEGFAALLEYDPQAESAANAEAMEEAAARVVAGEVTRAARDAETPVGPVQAGEWLGLSREGIEVHGSGLAEVTCALLERLLAPEHEIVTLIEGAGASEAVSRQVSEWLAVKHPGVSLERHRGGQPLYPFLLSIE
ncbi:MAG: domain fusion protein YloV [Acidimicrobiaceae bacterium]|nr:domain fusion protein YloV [Acidimicrobiaceae bacterium]